MMMLKILFWVFGFENGFALLITVSNLFSLVSIFPSEKRKHLSGGDLLVIFPYKLKRSIPNVLWQKVHVLLFILKKFNKTWQEWEHDIANGVLFMQQDGGFSVVDIKLEIRFFFIYFVMVVLVKDHGAECSLNFENKVS